MMNKINSVCVYCASSTKIDSVYFDAARELGALLGQRQIRLINGAGNMGLMSAVSDAALRAGGEVTGVIPHFMVEQGWHHTGLTQLVEVESMHQRKKTMADLSDAVIALPGGCGTLEELLEIINDFLGKMDAEDRDIFVRRYWFFDSVSAIAKRHAMSVGSVKMNLYRNRKKLLKVLEKEGKHL